LIPFDPASAFEVDTVQTDSATPEMGWHVAPPAYSWQSASVVQPGTQTNSSFAFCTQ
jgi:hypothetical protein